MANSHNDYSYSITTVTEERGNSHGVTAVGEESDNRNTVTAVNEERDNSSSVTEVSEERDNRSRHSVIKSVATSLFLKYEILFIRMQRLNFIIFTVKKSLNKIQSSMQI